MKKLTRRAVLVTGGLVLLGASPILAETASTHTEDVVKTAKLYVNLAKDRKLDVDQVRRPLILMVEAYLRKEYAEAERLALQVKMGVPGMTDADREELWRTAAISYSSLTGRPAPASPGSAAAAPPSAATTPPSVAPALPSPVAKPDQPAPNVPSFPPTTAGKLRREPIPLSVPAPPPPGQIPLSTLEAEKPLPTPTLAVPSSGSEEEREEKLKAERDLMKETEREVITARVFVALAKERGLDARVSSALADKAVEAYAQGKWFDAQGYASQVKGNVLELGEQGVYELWELAKSKRTAVRAMREEEEDTRARWAALVEELTTVFEVERRAGREPVLPQKILNAAQARFQKGEYLEAKALLGEARRELERAAKEREKAQAKVRATAATEEAKLMGEPWEAARLADEAEDKAEEEKIRRARDVRALAEGLKEHERRQAWAREDAEAEQETRRLAAAAGTRPWGLGVRGGAMGLWPFRVRVLNPAITDSSGQVAASTVTFAAQGGGVEWYLSRAGAPVGVELSLGIYHDGDASPASLVANYVPVSLTLRYQVLPIAYVGVGGGVGHYSFRYSSATVNGTSFDLVDTSGAVAGSVNRSGTLGFGKLVVGARLPLATGLAVNLEWRGLGLAAGGGFSGRVAHGFTGGLEATW